MVETSRRKPGMYEQIRANLWKSRILLALLVIVLASFGYSRCRDAGNVVAGSLWGVLILVYVAYFYRHTDELLLRISGATPANRITYAHYVNCVEAVSIAADIPSPKSYIVRDPAPSAFAVGRDPAHAFICVTTGMIDRMERDELEAVVGHEIAHIASCDTMLSTLTAAIGWTIQIVSLSAAAERVLQTTARLSFRLMIAVLLVVYAVSFWVIAGLREALGAVAAVLMLCVAIWIWAWLPRTFTDCLQSSGIRQRDFLADANAVFFTRHPRALIRALAKIRKSRRVLRRSHPSLVHLLIHNPAPQPKGWPGKLLSTHAPMEDRIRRLEEMCPPKQSPPGKRETCV